MVLKFGEKACSFNTFVTVWYFFLSLNKSILNNHKLSSQQKKRKHFSIPLHCDQGIRTVMKVIVTLGREMTFLVEGISSIPTDANLQLYIPHLCFLPLRQGLRHLKLIYTICNVSFGLECLPQ